VSGTEPMAELADHLAGWIADYIRSAGAEGAVFGVSGGIDSAVVCGLAARGLGRERCLGLALPIGNVEEDLELARVTAEIFGVRLVVPELGPAFVAVERALTEASGEIDRDRPADAQRDLAIANLKPRLRMTALYYFATITNSLVVGTGNRAELSVGYFTKWGDGGVDLLPLGNLTKGMVRDLATELGVPGRVMERPPSAGLWEGQTDEAELGLTYEQLDRYLMDGSSGDAEADGLIRALHLISRHKREPLPVAPLP
jgi:NAD+ synthase